VGCADNHDCEIAGLDLLVHEHLTRGATGLFQRRTGSRRHDAAVAHRGSDGGLSAPLLPAPGSDFFFLFAVFPLSLVAERTDTAGGPDSNATGRALTAGGWPCCRKPRNTTTMRANASAWPGGRKRRSYATSSST